MDVCLRRMSESLCETSGCETTWTSPDMGGESTRSAAGGIKQLVVVPGAGHKDIPATYGLTAYQALIRSFVDAQAQ